MNASNHPPFSLLPPSRRRPHHGAFALVITLLILSLLVVVAVSYLSSMVGERQTADAFTSKTRAEQMAQAGVDSATAILKEAFRDYPDSATVWDTSQSQNTDGTPDNQGTTLYLRAVPDGNYANPFPAGTSPAANAVGGNNPGNPACKNFVLPLISGVPGGRPQIVSNKASIFSAKINATATDPAAQTGTDLNVLRGKGDTQGVIGTPPVVTNGVAQPAGTPKPARAYWVNLKSNVKDANGNAPITGRYAFWIEDESFRINNNYFNSKNPQASPLPTAPPDNTSQPTPFPTASPATSPAPAYRGLDPSDSMLAGSLTQIGDSAASSDATSISNIRTNYPGKFFPDPLAFTHALPTPGAAPSPAFSFTQTQADLLRYYMTNQSGTLNLTRHGTQRLNLNDVVTNATNPTTATSAPPAAQSVIQSQVDQLVQTMKFHLPYLGERFYRTSQTGLSGLNSKILNDATSVPGSPVTSALASNHANMYYYKVAANILDYLDYDSQPTLIDPNGQALPQGSPAGTLTPGLSIWAQGKEIAPYIQEVAVRYRPVVYNKTKPSPPLQFEMQIDYYVELWNMSDRDIYASPKGGNPNLGDANLYVSNQHPWQVFPPLSPPNSTAYLQDSDRTTPGSILTSMGPTTDYQIDLTSGVFQSGSTTPVPGGVVFKAGTCTVITTDPDYMKYAFKGLNSYTPMYQIYPSTNTTNPAVPSFNPITTYYCSHLLTGGPNQLRGQRDYKGILVSTPATASGAGLKSLMRGGSQDAELEVYLGNSRGIIDSVPYAITEYGGSQYTDTDDYVNKNNVANNWDDYSYSSCIFGNASDGALYYSAIASQLGDPRTTNEQITEVTGYDTAKLGDQTRFVYPKGAADTTLGYPNGNSQKPDTVNNPWPDYYSLPPALNGVPNPAPSFVNSPMVVADAALTSIGQLGDVFDPARLPSANPPTGSGNILYSRGGGRTFKIGQHDDLYSNDPTTDAPPNNSADNVSASTGWASWRLADIFDAADPATDTIERPARLNINGVLRDKGAALLSLLQGFQFQPQSASGTADPIVHGDGHPITASSSLAGQPLDTTGTSNGFSQLMSQITARLNNKTPSAGPSGPFFERGEFGELGVGSAALFGASPPNPFAANKLLVNSVDMNKTFDHSREELFRRIAEMICTRGDTFTVYTVGQSISQPTSTSPLKVTGTHRMRVTFRLVPKAKDPNTGLVSDFHPGYDADSTTGALTAKSYPSFSAADATKRFARPDFYDVQILNSSVY